MTKPMLVGVTGSARSGKSTFGDMLASSLNRPVHFGGSAIPSTTIPSANIATYALASPIKDISCALLGWDERHREGWLKEINVSCLPPSRNQIIAAMQHYTNTTKEEANKMAVGFEKHISIPYWSYNGHVDISPREVFQLIGTEVCRSVRDSIWLDQAKSLYNNGSSLIITDVRFANEAAFIREHGLLVHIERADNATVASHASEAGITFKHGDVRVTNDGAIEELQTAAVWLADTIAQR